MHPKSWNWRGGNFGIAKFAVLSAAGKPLEYCLKYGGNLIFEENALQADWQKE